MGAGHARQPSSWASTSGRRPKSAMAAGAAPTASYETNGARLSFLSSVGRIRELAQRLEQASQLDPLSFTVSGDLQVALDAAGQPAKAQAEYERSLGLVGIHQRSHIYALMRVLARKDSSPAAIGKAFQTLLNDEKLPMSLSHALAKSYRDPAKVRDDIRKAMVDPANQDRVRMTVIAMYCRRIRREGTCTDCVAPCRGRLPVYLHALASIQHRLACRSSLQGSGARDWPGGLFPHQWQME